MCNFLIRINKNLQIFSYNKDKRVGTNFIVGWSNSMISDVDYFGTSSQNFIDTHEVT